MTQAEIDGMRQEIRALNFEMSCLATDAQLSPRMDLLAQRDAIERHMFSN